MVAFEVFWNELTHLCTEKGVTISKINVDWTTPTFSGNPVVYMERLLFILKNARNLEDQLTNLAGLSLNNYGAYYAAKYEGFKSVSAEMAFDYDADKQNLRPFTPDLTMYRVTLDPLLESVLNAEHYPWYRRFLEQIEDDPRTEGRYWLVNSDRIDSDKPMNLDQLKIDGVAIPFTEEAFVPPYQVYSKGKNDETLILTYDSKPIAPLDNFSALAFRFIGQQTSGIMFSSLIQQFNQFKKDFYGKYDFSAHLFSTLLLVSHERYVGDEPLRPLFRQIDHSACHKYVLNNALKELNKLYKLDIKLNDQEGMLFFYLIAGMNSSEFESLRLDKEESIKKILTQLQHNKFATLKYFRFRSETGSPKWPFVYAVDTAEFLAKDLHIAQMYHDDLLLFSGLINSEYDEVYHHARVDTTAPQIKINVERVKSYLHKAALQGTPNNCQYAVQVLLDCREFFSYKQFLDAMAQIDSLPAFDAQKVDAILKSHNLKIGAQLPALFNKDNADLKALMISLIMELDKRSKPEVSIVKTDEEDVVEQDVEAIKREEEEKFRLYEELSAQSIAEIQAVLKQKWAKSGTLLSIVGKLFLSRLLKIIKELTIQTAFKEPNSLLLKQIAEKIGELPDFQDHSDFEKVNRIDNEVNNLANLFKKMLNNPYVIEHEHEFVALFQRFNFSKIDYETLFRVLTLLEGMPQRNYLSLVTALLSNSGFTANKEKMLTLVDHLTILNNNCFPSSYLAGFSQLLIAHPEVTDFRTLTSQVINAYSWDNRDPVLELVMTDFTNNYKLFAQIIGLSNEIVTHRDKLSALFTSLKKANELDAFLNQLTACHSTSQAKILEIISKSYAVQRTNNTQLVRYDELITALGRLSPEHLTRLHVFYETTPVSLNCLANALKKSNLSTDFEVFLLEFEKAPFGTRDLAKQFDCSEVERVINNSRDLVNNSIYPYQYRKQLMEAFLFVNQIGSDLPVYNNKAAKDLSNAEIASLFADLKNNSMKHLTPFQKRLLALGLMREAMYRSTGEFPYSTQMMALIDGMLHKGDLIANIDTGQGKSLIDSMKAALLWLDSDRVDVSTSSLVDAKRDIANYGPFLKLLGIPYSQKTISASSEIGDFQKNGINFSAFSQLSLFFAKAKVTGTQLELPSTRVSLVLNESDYTLLDNRVIHRFASPDGAGVGVGQEWIYTAINEFVTRPGFLDNHTISARQDIDDLKAYLIIKLKENKKSSKLVNKFSDDQYLSWIESALVVNYQLKEKEDYVIPDEFEKKVRNGVELRSKVVKILMSDGKVSPDSVFGNGMQQLLYARLNKERSSADFMIEPQNKTIISSNNKNLLAYYRSKEGFIWGSSGTVGSSTEVAEQYAKYDFEFSKKEPHQKNRVKFFSPVVLAGQEKQFAELIRQLTASTPHGKSAPSIVFCKDIPTATLFFNLLKKQNSKNFPLQLYTGLGQEEAYIRNAGLPGMITITTSALGRNTDIPYDKAVGLNVWHTYVDSTRGAGQKSGRTGRQGSEGEVHYVLDKQEINDKTTKDITKEIDEKSAEARSASEKLYDVLGYLLAFVDQLPEKHFNKGKPAFFRSEWSKFSSEIETKFREAKRKISYDNQSFIEEAIASFNQLMKTVLVPVPEAVTVDQLMRSEAQKQVKAKYIPVEDNVTFADCTPPMAIAYRMLNFKAKSDGASISKDQVKEHLTQLFNKISTGSVLTINTHYLRYLCASDVTQEVIVNAHKEFLQEFIETHSKKRHFILRWLGFEGTLNQMASNQNYLLMFQAFTAIPGQTEVTLELIKNSVVTLLDEYLENSWFVSTERRNEAGQLKDLIAKAQDLETVIKYLSQSQVNTIKQDIETDKQATGLRVIKPLNFFGHSRYQTTLSHALNLATSLRADVKVDDKAMRELTSQVDELAGTLASDLTVDEVKQVKKKKSGTVKVIVSSIENTLVINQREPVGMVGRKKTGFFNSSQDGAGASEENKQELGLITRVDL